MATTIKHFANYFFFFNTGRKEGPPPHPPAVQWLKIQASILGGTGSIPDLGTKIAYAGCGAVRKNFRSKEATTRVQLLDNNVYGLLLYISAFFPPLALAVSALYRSWSSQGKNTRVVRYSLLQRMRELDGITNSMATNLDKL